MLKLMATSNFWMTPSFTSNTKRNFLRQLTQQLLVSQVMSETSFYSLKKLHAKKRRIVDRRASKSRKIRYNVRGKIVNFMAPESMAIPPMLPDLNNLFGLKKQG